MKEVAGGGCDGGREAGRQRDVTLKRSALFSSEILWLRNLFSKTETPPRPTLAATVGSRPGRRDWLVPERPPEATALTGRLSVPESLKAEASLS